MVAMAFPTTEIQPAVLISAKCTRFETESLTFYPGREGNCSSGLKKSAGLCQQTC